MFVITFWVCLFIVLYTYIGYGILIYILAKLAPYRSVDTAALPDEKLPPITLFITAYNEADIIDEKMANCLSLAYPSDRLRILWVIDGSTDHSETLLSNYNGIQIIHSPERRGKTAAINHGMQHVTTPFVIFTDANCMLNEEALKQIMRQFRDPSIGCVAGEKRIALENDDAIASKGESTYWKYESFLKRLDFQYYSTIGAAGELFAIRTALFKKMPSDTLLDDFMLSMLIAKDGYRIAYTPDAYAVERGSLDMQEEAKRKKRIAAGGWQSMWRLLPLLNILKYGRLSFQYVSHRVLRWSLAPVSLFMLWPLSLLLSIIDTSHKYVFLVIFALQIIFYICAYAGMLKKSNAHVPKLFYIPYYFIFMNINALKGIGYLLNNRHDGSWEKVRRR